MNQYLLLRDNKQTGPYSKEELITKGLKAYDLVWLEGRSAAWRYPSEFDELKPYAPVVEEQPFDRFYRKPADQVASTQSTGKVEQTVEQVTQQPVQINATPVEENNVTQPVAAKAAETNTTAKHIYVTMPGGKTPVTQKEEPKKEEKAQPVQQQQAATQKQESTPVQKNTPAVNNTAKSAYLVSEEDDELNSAMLAGYKSKKKEVDENNNGFISDYEARKAAFQSKKTGAVKEEAPVQKKEKAEPVAVKKTEKPAAGRSRKRDLKDLFHIPSHFSGSFFQDNKTLTRSLLAAVLILGGVVIGLIINSGKQHPPDTQVLETLVKEIREQQKDKSSATSPSSSEPNNKRSDRQDGGSNNDNLNNYTEQPSTSENTIGSEPNNHHAIIKKETNTTPTKPISVPVSNTTTEEVETQPAVNDNKEKVNQETIEKARRNIYDLVGVEASQYKVGLLGGISDLDITISNNSLYALDQVDVEVKYFGPEKKLVKTQTLKFSHIPAGKQRTLEAPSTRRGITIDYSITGINSKALGMAQAGY